MRIPGKRGIFLLFGSLTLLWVACSQSTPFMPSICQSDTDCPAEQRCINRVCFGGTAQVEVVRDGSTEKESTGTPEANAPDTTTPQENPSGPDTVAPEKNTTEPSQPQRPDTHESTQPDTQPEQPQENPSPEAKPEPGPSDNQVLCPASCLSNTDCLLCQGKTECRNGTCQAPQTACSQDSQCAAGQICENSVCVVGCRTKLDCNQQEICVNDKCVPGCKDDIDCLSQTEICVNDRCVTGCSDIKVCPGKQRICKNNQCIDGCNSDSDCPKDHECDNNKCKKD